MNCPTCQNKTCKCRICRGMDASKTKFCKCCFVEKPETERFCYEKFAK